MKKLRRVSPHRNAPRPTRPGAEGSQAFDTPTSILLSVEKNCPCRWPMIHCARASDWKCRVVEGIHEKGSFGAKNPRRGTCRYGRCGRRLRIRPNVHEGKNVVAGQRERNRSNRRMNHLYHQTKLRVTYQNTRPGHLASKTFMGQKCGQNWARHHEYGEFALVFGHQSRQSDRYCRAIRKR